VWSPGRELRLRAVLVLARRLLHGAASGQRRIARAGAPDGSVPSGRGSTARRDVAARPGPRIVAPRRRE